MSQVPADEQMRSRLQGLKASGAFSRDAQGRLPELDPAIAAELIDGEKPALFPVGSGQASPLPGAHPLDIPRDHAPLPSMRSPDVGAPGGSSSEPVPRKGSGRVSKDQTRHTEELMRQISTELEQFNKNLVVSFETAKENMQRDLVNLFDTTSREKLPDCFLKSLPKFGGGVTKLHQHFFRQSANRKKEHTQMDRRDVPIDLVVQPEVRQEISDDIHAVIDRILKSCCGEGGTVTTDLQRILNQVHELMMELSDCEKAKKQLMVETSKLEEELNEKEKQTTSLERQRQNLIQEARMMDADQDKTRERCLREMQLRRDRQQQHLREILRHRTQIFQVQAANQELQERINREQKLSPRSREAAKEGRRESSSGMYASAEMNFDLAMGVDSGDTAAAVEEAEKRLRSEMEEKHRQQAKDERERHMKEENKLRIKLEEQIEECKRLEKEHLKIETELVEVKQTLRLGKREAEGN